MSGRVLLGLVVLVVVVPSALADDVLYRYEADVLPYDESTGWVIADPCEPPCSESLEDGHFVLHWSEAYNMENYHFSMSQLPGHPLPTLWVEWRFRSNHPYSAVWYGCDGRFKVRYGIVSELLYMQGDAVFSFAGDLLVSGLALDEFHTCRFESLDGVNFRISVDGLVVMDRPDNHPTGSHYLQF